MRRFFQRHSLLAQQEIENIGNNFGIGQQLAAITKHFHKAAVGIIRRDLTVVYNRVIQHRKGMRAAPPAGSVGWIPTVCGPAVAGVFIQPIELAHILGEADRFEHTHVFAAGENVRTGNFGVDPNHAARHKLALIQLAVRQFVRQRGDKVAPDQRLIGDARHLFGGDLGQVDNIKMPIQESLALRLGVRIVIKHMERIELGVFGIDTVSGKTAAQTV